MRYVAREWEAQGRPVHRDRQGVCLGIVALALTFCASATSARAPSPAGSDVVVQALTLLGTPYRFGGASPATGFDCSGLVRHVFAEAMSQQLPRRSEQMQRHGQPVPRDALRPGDLLFFNTEGRPFSHVAIYIGDGRFIHAPAGKGVVRIERLHERYWASRFDGARRLLGAAALSSVNSDAKPADAMRAQPGSDASPPRDLGQ